MRNQHFRLPEGGLIDRSRPLSFRFDGRPYQGYEGDTLASALVANGVALVGRSFKYHRPRGILTAGPEEPNALVTVGRGSRIEPNARATTIELKDGLEAHPQNCWPSLRFDLGAITRLLSPVFPAGFYYKTFIGGPKQAWTRLYEPVIRRMAGLGPAPAEPDPDLYDKRHVHCDVLVVGAGPAGLAAANAALAAGAKVVLVEEMPWLGGRLAAADEQVEGMTATKWVEAAVGVLRHDRCRLLTRTTAFGRYDQNLVMAVERMNNNSVVRQRLWQIRARHIVLATGAHEQPLPFADNDRPGIMLAGAGQDYARCFAALVGRRVAVATAGESGHAAASTLAALGAEIVAIADSRKAAKTSHDLPVLWGAMPRRALGRSRVKGLEIVTGQGASERFECDTILMSGGWQPALHLHCHVGGRTRYDSGLGCFVPDNALKDVISAGACAGSFQTEACIAQGMEAGRACATGDEAPTIHFPAPFAPEPIADRPISSASGKIFIDFQNDVTASDIRLAAREGFVSVEHLKRYTTTGMATDQGKLSNLNALKLLGAEIGSAPGTVGTTTFRPPYTPVTFGALAASDRGQLTDPIRTTPMHAWHEAAGAIFENVGQWKRPYFYPRPGETMADAVRRECRAVRTKLGLFDASTLGKIDIQGPDAALFLERVYTNAWSKLAVGRCRYGLMLREDGMVMDDGVTTRIGPQHYLMTTTTGNAAPVFDHLEDLLQTEWPDLKVYLTSVTDHWAVAVVTGPKARDLLATVVSDCDLANDAFAHLSYREGRIGEVPVRLYRISFTGELSYEIHIPAGHGASIWQQLHEAGTPLGITPYGTEAMHVLRAEKGYIIIGQETDGSVTPDDLGLGWAIARAKPDFIGKRSLTRSDTSRDDRQQLVGLVPLDGRTVLEEGSHLTAEAGGSAPVPMIGRVTSTYWSETCAGPIALALLERGRSRDGEILYARFPGQTVACRVTAPCFYDAAGERMNG